jgi:hypothetical protein
MQEPAAQVTLSRSLVLLFVLVLAAVAARTVVPTLAVRADVDHVPLRGNLVEELPVETPWQMASQHRTR